MIFRLRWTGLGWISPVLLVVTLIAGAGAAAAIGSHGDAAAALAVAAVLVAGAAVTWALGRQLNREQTADGWVRTFQHTCMDTPMEHTSLGFVVFALIILATVIGRATSPLLGWLTFAAVLVGAWVLVSGRRKARFLRLVADREEYADQRGWRYTPLARTIGERWKEVLGWRAASIGGFGVVSGELNGLPFTVFDSMTGLDLRTSDVPRTIWAVHLPVALPRLVVKRPYTAVGELARELFADALGESLSERAPLRPEDVQADCDVPGFAEALLTPEVRSATAASELAGWEIAGRDLVFTSLETGVTMSPTQIDAVLHRLVALAHTFSPEVVGRYSVPPSTDVPAIA
ncbi:MAG: hypothetical protein PV358_04185 [Acidimicrobiales bacterium]|nr:hypothetical protein [Acidimicrobiales bacterium]